MGGERWNWICADAHLSDELPMRLYHFLNREFGLDDIRHRRLKIATLNELNDPFEMLAMSFKDQTLRDAFRATKEQMAQRFGLLCFSRSWHNPVQWSHYADRHRGLCLQFEVRDDLAKPVTYTKARLAVDSTLIGGQGQDAEEFIQRAISTKFSHWRYEDEVRLFVRLEDRDEETGFWFKDFDADLRLTEVIVGVDSDASRNEIGDALGDVGDGVSLRKARLSFRQFAVVTQLRGDMWS